MNNSFNIGLVEVQRHKFHKVIFVTTIFEFYNMLSHFGVPIQFLIKKKKKYSWRGWNLVIQALCHALALLYEHFPLASNHAKFLFSFAH
jgi:hypothetical protein